MGTLHEVLGTDPDGREIFRYRVSDDGYRRLRLRLREWLELRELARASPEVCGAFCVFVAEWWRREHTGGVWKWSTVLSELGASQTPYGDVTNTVSRGLRYLERPLIRNDLGHRAFLVTLACEGGLPLRRLEVDGAHLRRYFRAVLRHFQAMGYAGTEAPEELEQVAARFDHRVPKRLRHAVVHRLVGELVGRAWGLRQLLEDTTDPIGTLDQQAPKWRERLPLLLEDQVARTVILGLLRDVAKASKRSGQVSVQTSLVKGTSGATLRREFTLPSELSSGQFKALFDREPPPAGRLPLHARGEDGTTVRIGTLIPAGNASWAIRVAQGATLEGATAQGQITLQATSANHGVFHATGVRGAEPLGPLPWVFREGSRSNRWELVGVGSTSRRETPLLVATPRGTPLSGSDLERFDWEVHGRQTFLVRSEATADTDAGTVRIRPGAAEGSSARFRLKGKQFDGVATSRGAWLGIPRLVRCEHYGESHAALQIKEQGRWRTPRSDDVGEFAARSLQDGDVVFRAQIRIVPADLSLDLRVGDGRTPGCVVASSAQLHRIGSPTDPRWDTRLVEEGPTSILEATAVDAAPTKLPIRLQFAHGHLDGTVPFPSRTLHFEGVDGEILPTDTSVHIKRLGGIRAVALTPSRRGRFTVTLQARVPNAGPTPSNRSFELWRQPSGEMALDLRDVTAAATEMLDATEHLDAYVVFRLEEIGGSARSVTLIARRYDWVLRRDETTGDVILDGPANDELEGVEVEARPFADVRTVEPLPRLISGRFAEPRFAFHPTERAAGSWLVTAKEGGWYRCRPVPFTASGPGEAPESALAAAFELPSEPQRHLAIAQRLEAMNASWQDPDWDVVQDYLRLLGDLPASTFDLIRLLVCDTRACAMAAMHIAGWDEASRVAVREGLEELLFLWEGISVADWHHAFDRLHEVVAPVAPDLAVQEVLSRASRFNSDLYSLEVAAHLWARRKGVEKKPSQLVEFALNPASATALLGARSQLVSDLVQGHTAAGWIRASTELPELEAHHDLIRNQPEYQHDIVLAPVVVAMMGVGRIQPEKRLLLFLEEARAFDEAYFDQCYRYTFAALVARDPSLQ